MSVKYMAAGLAASALFATVAFAQTPMTNSDKSTSATLASDQSFHGTWRTSKLVGLSVYNENNESIGSINDLLADKSGNIKAVVIGVGGFLGVGEHLVAVAFDKVKFVDQPAATAAASDTSTSPAAGNRPASSTTTGSATSTASTSSKSNPWYPDHAVLNATKDQLKAMPEFKYST